MISVSIISCNVVIVRIINNSSNNNNNHNNKNKNTTTTTKNNKSNPEGAQRDSSFFSVKVSNNNLCPCIWLNIRVSVSTQVQSLIGRLVVGKCAIAPNGESNYCLLNLPSIYFPCAFLIVSVQHAECN